MFETMSSAFVDEFPHIFRNKKTLWTAAVCLIEFLLGLPFVTKGGIYLLQIMDWYSSAFSIMILSFMECVVIAYVYGVDRFYNDIELMIGRKPCLYYKVCWMAVTPFTIMFILIFSMVIHTPVTYGDYTYPMWAIAIGWMMAIVSLIPIPVVMIVEVCKQEGNILQRIKKATRPAKDWGPASKKYHDVYQSPSSTNGDIVSNNVTMRSSSGNDVVLKDWKPYETQTDDL